MLGSRGFRVLCSKDNLDLKRVQVLGFGGPVRRSCMKDDCRHTLPEPTVYFHYPQGQS